MSLSPAELDSFVHAMLRRTDLWADHVRHESDERAYHQIWDDEQVNAWLICWSEDQDTGFHDHDDSAATIHVISGQVREDRLRLQGDPTSRTARAGETFHVPAFAIHRVLHAGRGPAVTIHAYSPPLRAQGAYRQAHSGALERVPQPLDAELKPEAVAA